MADNDIEVKFGAQTSELEGGVGKANELVQGFTDKISEMTGNLTDIGAAIAAAFTFDKLEEFTHSMAELGEQVEHTAAITGLSIEQVQEFQNVVRGTGGDIGTADMALMRLNRNISEAAAGLLPQAEDAFRRLGVSQQELERGNLNEIMATMATTMHNTADGANKVEAMFRTVGRSGAQLIPIFDLGEEGIKKLNTAFAETGANLGEDFASKLEGLAQQMYLAQAASQGVSNVIMQHLLPGIDAAAVGITMMKEEFSKSIQEGGVLSIVLDTLSKGLVALVIGAEGVKTAFDGLINFMQTGFKILAETIASFSELMVDVFSGNFSKVKTDFNNDWAEMEKTVADSMQKMSGESDKFAKDFAKIMDAYNGKGVGIGAGRGNPNNKLEAPQKIDTKTDDGDKDRSLYAAQYQNKKETDDLMVESGQMSHQQEYADLSAALDKEKALVDASYMEQAQQYDKDSIEYQKVITEKEIADQKFANEHIKLTMEATKNDAALWTSAINSINKDWDQMIQGVFQGTQTMGQLFQRMAQNMVVAFISAIGRIIAENALLILAQNQGWTQMASALTKNLGQWVLTENQKTAATVAGTATRTAANTAAATAGDTTAAASASTQIMQDAYESAANVYASVSAIPLVGWIMAPLAAAGAFAAVAAFDSFDKGTDYVPHDMLANIHQGEIIIPRAQSDEIRSGHDSIGSGGAVHFHISSMDSAGVASMLRNNHKALGAAIHAAARGNSAGLRQAVGRM